MQTQEVTIKPHVRVVMQSDTELLDEVVVVAYGTATKNPSQVPLLKLKETVLLTKIRPNYLKR